VTRRDDSDANAAGRVRVPADVGRPDKLLGGLTARQLAILAVAAVVLWAGYAASRRLVPAPAYAAAAIPLAAVAVVLAVGRIEGTSADRYLLAALAHRASPRRLVPAPGGIPAASALVAGQAGAAPAPLRLAIAGVDDHGVVDLGADGQALICRASASSFSLRTPAEQEAMVAGFARFLNSLSEPVQIVVRAEPVDLAPTVAALEEAAPGLPHPDLEAAARDHARFLADLARRGLLARRVLVVLRRPASRSDDDGAEGLARRATEAAAALAATGVTLQPLDQEAATSLLAEAADPANPQPVTPSPDDAPVTAADDPHGDFLEGDLW
jgi:hypothetical protein